MFALKALIGLVLLTITLAGNTPSKPADNKGPPPPASNYEVEIANAEIGVAERDQTTVLKTQPLTWPSTSKVSLEADHHQRLQFKFAIKDKKSGVLVNPHQVFVQLTNQQTKQDIFFVAEPESAVEITPYKFDLNVATRAKDFNHVSGDYSIQLIVGDAYITNSFIWNVGTVKLSFPTPSAELSSKPKSSAPWMKVHYGAKPEIKHLFREPEKRPPTFVSDLFTGLLFVPISILFGLWIKIGVNVSGMPLSLSALVFHGTLAAIFALYTLFWLKLNMFTTLKWLWGLGIVALLSGHSLLRNLASRREKASKSA